jgi:hypothetical protein
LTSHSGFYVRWVAAAGHVPCSHDGGFFLFAQAFILRQPQMTRHGSSFSSIFSLFLKIHDRLYQLCVVEQQCCLSIIILF